MPGLSSLARSRGWQARACQCRLSGTRSGHGLLSRPGSQLGPTHEHKSGYNAQDALFRRWPRLQGSGHGTVLIRVTNHFDYGHGSGSRPSGSRPTCGWSRLRITPVIEITGRQVTVLVTARDGSRRLVTADAHNTHAHRDTHTDTQTQTQHTLAHTGREKRSEGLQAGVRGEGIGG